MRPHYLTGLAATALTCSLNVVHLYQNGRVRRVRYEDSALLITRGMANARNFSTARATDTCTASTPLALKANEAASPSPKQSTRNDELPPIIDTPLPPRPAFYVPPQERDPSDESLAFLKPGSPLQHLKHRSTVVEVPEGVERAPSIPQRHQTAPIYMDTDAARVGSTSVHAGQSLLQRSGVDTSAYYYSTPRSHSTAEEGAPAVGAQCTSHRSRLHVLHEHSPHRGKEAEPLGTDPAADVLTASIRGSGSDGVGGSDGTSKKTSMFALSHEFSSVDQTPEELEDGGQRAAPKANARQLEADIKKLEYYQGSPQYDKLLADFRAKYSAEGDGDGADISVKRPAKGGLVYTTEEVDRGLVGQPIDYHHSSIRLQAQLLSGPRAYDPVTIMQQQGVLRYQGYAFPPTAELGKLKMGGDVNALRKAHRSNPLVAKVRRGINALIGRRDALDDYVAMEDKPKEDTHLLYRTLGLEAAQRRQMRYMLTDFDYADRNTTFHVMMSYPYTDWLHVFYMVLVGWILYQLQVRWGAYDFYDEYLGLDLRQVPSLKKPVLAGITILVTVFLLFQPLSVASIATTRAYRIALRRPIGPP